MTSQTGKARVDWRRAVIGGALVVGLMSGFGVSTAFAQPAEPAGPSGSDRSCTGDDCSRKAEAAVAAAAGCEPDDKKCSDAANAPRRVNADRILMLVHEQYHQGDGGGQISKLIDDAIKLRAQGFRPSNTNALALQDALARRPNQAPLIEALQATVSYQRKLMARSAIPAPPVGAPPVATPGSPGGGMGPSWGPGSPMQQDSDTIFPMPGR